MKKKFTFRQKLSFKFDMLMSKGVVSKVIMLIALTVVFVLVFGILASIALGDFKGMVFWTSWKTLMYTLDPGNLDGAEGTVLYIGMMFVATLYGLFFTAVLIGLINDAISQKMDSLAKSRSTVIAEGHTVILGFNETTFIILHELFEANLNQKEKQTVIVMDDADSVEMNEKIAEFASRSKTASNTKVYCRSGVIYDVDDLEKCSLTLSRAIIINSSDDFETTKAILACTSILNENPEDTESYTVAVVYHAENEDAARIAGNDGKNNDRLVMLPLQNTLARIAVHTSRQPGLSKVFTELFSFDGNEFYILDNELCFPRLYGRSIEEINRMLKAAVALGVFREGAGVLIDDPSSVTFQKGDRLIVLQDDDDPLLAEDAPAEPAKCPELKAIPTERSVCLVIGAKSITEDVLIEEPEYLSEGSKLIVADTHELVSKHITKDIASVYAEHGIGFEIEEVDDLYTRATVNRLMDRHRPDSILMLGSGNDEGAREEDENMLKVLLYLKEYKEIHNCRLSITCQLNNVLDQKLATVISSDDFIISKHIAALLMTQIAQTRKVRQLFDVLLQSEGYEIYIEKAKGYVPTGRPIDLYTAMNAVSKQKKILIGIRQMQDGRLGDPVLNPRKYNEDGTLKQYTFGDEDCLVILAEEFSK